MVASAGAAYRFYGSFEAQDFFLEQMQSACFTSVAGESCSAGGMDAVHPSI